MVVERFVEHWQLLLIYFLKSTESLSCQTNKSKRQLGNHVEVFVIPVQIEPSENEKQFFDPLHIHLIEVRFDTLHCNSLVMVQNFEIEFLHANASIG